MINNKITNIRTLTQQGPFLPASLSSDGIFEDPMTKQRSEYENILPEVLFITSYPPRECGIATYSQDLINSLTDKFGSSFTINICALESGCAEYNYNEKVKFILDTSKASEYINLLNYINYNQNIKVVLIQHEFGFYKNQPNAFLHLLYEINKPIVIAFHTVLPNPNETLKIEIKNMIAAVSSIIVMTNNAAKILKEEYHVENEKIEVIPHGTHLVPHLSKDFLKDKFGYTGKKILSTFGLLSSGKSIETTIESMPAIIKRNPEALFLIIGKTHPEVVKTEGEAYRKKLKDLIIQYGLQDHVVFVNKYLALSELLEYLQLTDIYIFTSKDPNQAVSGTFAYAMSCACPIISTPIPHAKELLTDNAGIIFDFQNSEQLTNEVAKLLNDEVLRKDISSKSLQKIVSTVWENSAILHAQLLEKVAAGTITIQYTLPPINLNHLKQMTTVTGIIQFSKINQPDIESGYTLDDNARALVAMCMHYKLTGDEKDIYYINKYLTFIGNCLQPEGHFLNYMDKNNQFTAQNKMVNLDDSNGRAIWSLGYTTSLKGLLPGRIIEDAEKIIEKSLSFITKIRSPRAIAFSMKGLYYYYQNFKTPKILNIIRIYANRLARIFKHEATDKWKWFESYLTYANSVLPEALLYAWLLTREILYKEIALASMQFLMSKIFNENGIEVISNKRWLQKGKKNEHRGEQPIDVSYTIMTLNKFYEVFRTEEYRDKIVSAFNWFLGKNRLHQIIYNPCTGGCYDGLEETHVNLNQGAESTLSYLMARLTMEKYKIEHLLQSTFLPNIRENTNGKI